MKLPIDDVWVKEPNLLIPGRGPFGPCKLNPQFSVPPANAWLATPSRSFLVDMARRLPDLTVGTDKVAIGPGVWEGMYGYKINDEDYDASSPYVQPRLYIPVESSPAVSGAVAALAVVQSNGGTYVGGSGYSNRGVIGRYRGHDDSGNIQAWRQWELFAGYQIPANGNWVVGANMSNTGSSTPNGAASGATQISDKKWHVIAMRFVPSTEVSVYLDGKKDGTNTTSIISSVYTGGSPPLEIGWQFAATAITPAQPYALHGSLAFVCWWNTIIPSDAMMCDLTRDPYQILIPA